MFYFNLYGPRPIVQETSRLSFQLWADVNSVIVKEVPFDLVAFFAKL